MANQYSTADYQRLAHADAIAAGIDPQIFENQIAQESAWNPNAVSSAGAIGIAQFMPATAAGVHIDPHDPVASLQAAAQLMGGYLKQFGSMDKALAAYNAGPGSVTYAIEQGGDKWLGYTPAETQNYVKVIEAGTTPQTTPVATSSQGSQTATTSLASSLGLPDIFTIPARSVKLGIGMLLLLAAFLMFLAPIVEPYVKPLGEAAVKGLLA